MSFSNSSNLELGKKSSSSDNFGNLFENSTDKNNDNRIEEEKDNDSDDLVKKFGSDHDKSSNKNEDNEEEEEDEEQENFQLNIIEDDSKEKFSIGKYINKSKKKERKNKYKNQKHKKDDTYSKEDTENMDMVYSSSENFIQDKIDKKHDIINQKKNSNSRFFHDFTIIKKLGKGGQGTVFEVKNNFDMQHYAIKRIILRLQQDKQEEHIKEIKNEIYILSRHKSPYLVRYYQTWIEDYNKDDYADDSDFDETDEISSITNRKISFEEKSRSTLEKNESNTKNYISEEESSSDEKDKKVNIWDDDDDEKESDEEDDDSDSEKRKDIKKNYKNNKNEKDQKKNKMIINSKSKNKKEKLGLKILYIQMELCGNKTLREAIDNNQLKTDDIKWKYISQLLLAIQYVHSNGFIHRDLKPGNIFIDNDNDIKLGDFGLVKEYSTVKSDHNSIWSRSLFRKNDSSKIINYGGQLITMGIGTKFYCSPEQELSDNYDNKTDIYSLGIIIFEMFYKFSSLMERDIILTRINKNSKFPDDLEEVCGKNVSKLILKCTLHKPSLRPSIKQIIESKLIPSFETKQNILNQFNEFLEKNLKLINDFMNNIIEKKKKIFSEVKKSIINNENDSNQDDNLTDSILSLNKSQLKRDFTDSNRALMDYENSYSSLFSSVIKLLELNSNKDNVNDSSIFSLSVYQLLYFQIQKILNNYNAFYYKFSEYELLNQYNDFCYYNSTKKKFCRIYLNDENCECFVTETGRLLSKSKNLFSNFNKMISSILNSRFNHNFTPITFYYDSSGNIKYRSPYSSTKEFLEYNDIICTSLWKDSEDSFDYDNKYIINNLKIILNILSDFKFASKNIIIRINSSIILDAIYDHFLKKNIEPKKLDETKINILLTISSVLNKRDAQYHINDLTEKLKKNNMLNKIPIQINDLKSLIKTYYNKKNANCKTLESFEEKEKRINEENNIKSYFDDLYWEANIQNLLKYKDSVQIDYMLIPENLQFYSGFFMQVCYKKKNMIIPLIEGGITDNYFYNPEKTTQLKGFSFIINMKNIYELKIASLGKLGNSNNNLFLYDCLIIRTDENVAINHLNELGKFCLESGLKYQIIYKPQSENYEFEKYYIVYRMKYLISINLVERKKEKKRLTKVEKTKGNKDKKEKEKEEKEKEREERENVEVTYTIEEKRNNLNISKDENLSFDKIRKKFSFNSSNS